jgi:hypothetical protein
MKKFNLEVGRIRGWLKDPVHAAEELDMDIEEATKYWDCGFKLLPENMATLLPNFNFPTKDETSDEDTTQTEIQTTSLYDDEVLKKFESGSLF